MITTPKDIALTVTIPRAELAVILACNPAHKRLHDIVTWAVHNTAVMYQTQEDLWPSAQNATLFLDAHIYIKEGVLQDDAKLIKQDAINHSDVVKNLMNTMYSAMSDVRGIPYVNS